jgi:hypothetical protein
VLHKAEAINKSIHTYGILLSYYELFVNNHLSEYSVSLVGTALLNLFHCSFTLHSNSSRVSVTLHTEASSSQTCSQITRASSLIKCCFKEAFFKKKNCKSFLNVFYLLQSVKYNPLMAKFFAGYLLISSRSVAIFAVQQIDKNASI